MEPEIGSDGLATDKRAVPAECSSHVNSAAPHVNDLPQAEATQTCITPEASSRPSEEEEDDWESSWEKGMPNLKLSDDAQSSTPTGSREQPPCAPSSSHSASELDSTNRRTRKGRGEARFGFGMKVQAEIDGDGEEEGETDETGEVLGMESTVRIMPHIVEVYGLSTSVTLTHLDSFLDSHSSCSIRPVIKWLNDETALVVCPNAEAAQELLTADQRKYKLRPYSDASEEAYSIHVEELLPPRPRPATTAAVARRLLSSALGRPELRDRKAEADLAEARRAARSTRAARSAAMEAAWEAE